VATTRIVWRPARNPPTLIRTENRLRVVRLIRLPSRKTSTLRIPDASLTLTRALTLRLGQSVALATSQNPVNRGFEADSVTDRHIHRRHFRPRPNGSADCLASEQER